jgi:protein ImuA
MSSVVTASEAKKERQTRLSALRTRIRVIERGAEAGPWRSLPLGPAGLDAALPGGGLPLAGLHAIEPGRREWDDGPVTGFCLALVARLLAATTGPLLWAARHDDLYGPAAAAVGLTPARLLRVRAGDDAAVCWTLEEALGCAGLVGVVGELCEPLERSAGRRLQLAAEAAGQPCLLLQRQRLTPRRGEAASPALTRWRVSAAPSAESLPRDLVGRPRWRLELLRCRSGRPASFDVEWNDATGALALAAGLRDRDLAAAAAG